jgi:hypothetical protein
MPNLVAYNSGNTISNSIQFGTIVMDVNGDVDKGSLNWCPDFGICNQYIIITDTYTNGKTDQLNARAMGFQTSGLTNSDLIVGINKLAASKFAGPFGSLSSAINWAIYEGYFIINQEYPTIVTSGCVLNLDSNFPPSYPLTFDTWYDLTGNGNTGLLNNGITYNSALRGSLLLNGSNQYVSFSATTDIPVGNSNYTISVWFNPSTTSGDRGLVGWGNFGTPNQVNALKITSSGLVNYWWANDLQANYSFTIGDWYNAVATFDGTTRSLWINGSLISSDTPVGHNVPYSTNLEIGVTNGIEFFGGNMGEVQIFNRALSSTEVYDNYNALYPRYNGTYTDPCSIAPLCTPTQTPASTPPSTPALTPTPTVTPLPRVWNLYFPCNTTNPGTQVIPFSTNYLGGEIIKGSNGLCYTIAVSGYSLSEQITVDEEFSTCEDCELTLITPTPTMTETPTQTPSTTPPSTPASTPEVTPTPTTSPLPAVWNLYFPCNTTNPATQVIPFNSNYTPGVIFKGSNGLCYTIALSGYSLQPTIDLVEEYSNCADCELTLITPTPTMSQTPTQTPSTTPPSTPASTPALTPTPTTTPPPQVWNLYYPCNTTNPATQVIPFNTNYTPGIIFRGSNGLCYTIAVSGYSLQPTIDLVEEFGNCGDCEISLITPTPTQTPTSTLPLIVANGTYVCANGTDCDGEFNITSITGGAGGPYQTKLDSGAWNDYPAVSSYTSLCGGQSYTLSIKDSQGNIRVSDPFVMCMQPTPTPTQTPTPTPAPSYHVWNLYRTEGAEFPACSTVNASQVIDYNSNYAVGLVFKGSDGLCYVIANDGFQPSQPTLTVGDEFGNCTECTEV